MTLLPRLPRTLLADLVSGRRVLLPARPGHHCLAQLHESRLYVRAVERGRLDERRFVPVR